MSLSLSNKDIEGLRVQATQTLHFHTSDPSNPEEFRHFEIPEGTLGTLTGEITIYYADSNEGACKAVAMDAGRLKRLLEHPEAFAQLGKALNYWEAAKNLKGDQSLAASISLNVMWDSVANSQSRKGKFLSYVPWLKLVDSK
jgi:hypothetical protein